MDRAEHTADDTGARDLTCFADENSFISSVLAENRYRIAVARMLTAARRDS